MVDKTPNAKGGKKYDSEKPRCYLLSAPFLLETAKVLTIGGNTYGDNNWRNVERERYESAAYRHWLAYMSGEKNDPETGLSHLAHLNCDIGFLYEFDKMEEKRENYKWVIEDVTAEMNKKKNDKTPSIVRDFEIMEKDMAERLKQSRASGGNGKKAR